MTTPYDLFYWPSIQGRGEFVRLALEEAGAPYADVARRAESEGGGVPALMQLLRAPGLAPFAPPILRAGDLVIAQTANILLYLGKRHHLVPDDEAGRLHAHQLQLTITDLVAEVHETHHPIAASLYYEDQKPEARRRSDHFGKERLPKFLSHFERALAGSGHAYVFGDDVSTVDLSLFQVLEGLRYAFPRAMEGVTPGLPRLLALGERVRARPRISAYLASPRRLPFNEHGIFRRYPELESV